MVSLTAEQKTIQSLYCTTSEKFVSPMYQRPYSWGEEQWSDLLRDLKTAYTEQEKYFLGNLILARSAEFTNTGEQYIVDGQQRILTLWVLIKLLSLMLDNISSLKTAISYEPWEGENNEPKIKSLVFENDDDSAIRRIFEFSLDDIKKLSVTPDLHPLEQAILYFYERIKIMPDLKSESNGLNEFARYLMRSVTLLPIVQSDDSVENAERRALKIFETINNRGMDLENADIFKARIYQSISDDDDKAAFVNQWTELKNECITSQMSLDDLFRLYSHVIRGQQGITTGERKLRDFFLNESFSPLTYKSYTEILNDLYKLIEIAKFVNYHAVNDPILGRWINVIRHYTNQYPTFAIVVYAFNHGYKTDAEKQRMSTFLQSLIRLILYTGTTTGVKFAIYNVIKRISNATDIDQYHRNFDYSWFDGIGRLNQAYALLAYTLKYNINAPADATVDKLVSQKDILSGVWKFSPSKINSLGNLIVTDLSKKYTNLQGKLQYLQSSKLPSVKEVLNTKWGYAQWEARDAELKDLIIDFFSGKTSKSAAKI